MLRWLESNSIVLYFFQLQILGWLATAKGIIAIEDLAPLACAQIYD